MTGEGIERALGAAAIAAVIALVGVVVQRRRTAKQPQAEAGAATPQAEAIDVPALTWSDEQGHDRTGVEAHLAAFDALHALHSRVPVDSLLRPDREARQKVLTNVWGIEDTPRLRSVLLDLLWRGQRQQFERERATWSALTPSEAREVEQRIRERADREEQKAVEELVRFHRVREQDPSTMDVDFLVWDHVRVIGLVRDGLSAGLLSEAEARDTALIAAHALREACSSWEDFSEQMRAGRRYWGSLDGRVGERLDAITRRELELLLAEPTSPWMTIPWLAPLPDPTYLLIDGVLADDSDVDPVDDLPPSFGRSPSWRARMSRVFAERVVALRHDQ